MDRLAGTPARLHYRMISDYFPGITPLQSEQFSTLESLYRGWNEKINVISRKDIEHFEIRHLIHSLSIARIFSFRPGTRIMDAGTGGGLPGIPLAIFFPEVQFFLIDSIGKKIQVVQAICSELGLDNVTAMKARFEAVPGEFDFITGRAVTALPDLFRLLKKKVSSANRNEMSNGIIYLKGGDFDEELKMIKARYDIYKMSDYFEDAYFETKKIVYLHDFI